MLKYKKLKCWLFYIFLLPCVLIRTAGTLIVATVSGNDPPIPSHPSALTALSSWSPSCASAHKAFVLTLNTLVKILKLDLGQYSEARFGQVFNFQDLWTVNCDLVIWIQPWGPLCLWQRLITSLPQGCCPEKKCFLLDFVQLRGWSLQLGGPCPIFLAYFQEVHFWSIK